MVAQTKRESFRIAISGYYGFHNSGDEAVLRSILLALSQQAELQGVQIEPVVLSADPKWTSEAYGVEAAHRMQPKELLQTLRSCDGLISGGGSLLQDATGSKTIPYYTGVMKLAQWLGKPVFIYAQGIGPVNRSWAKPLIKHVMKRSRYISVRDAESASFLTGLGIEASRVELVPDPVMGMPLPAGADKQPEASKSSVEQSRPSEDLAAMLPVVGVSLRKWREDGADMARIIEGLAALTHKRDVVLRFLPFHLPPDKLTSEQVIAELKSGIGAGSRLEIVDGGENPQQMLLEVSRCDMLFGMRLHALIYAANQQVPMLGLSYDPKIDQFLARLNLTAVGSTERLDTAVFVERACSLLDQKEQWIERHQAEIDQLRQQSQQPAQQIIHYLRQNRSR